MKRTRRKNLICFALIFSMVLCFILTGCGVKNESGTKIVCVDFYEYDWVKNILGENPGDIELCLLNDTGTDMHSFQPTVKDMATLYDCDLLIYTDGISEFWIEDAIGNKDEVNSFSLMEYFLNNDEITKNYVLDEDEDEEESSGHDQDADEHIHLSLRLAEYFARGITEKICKLDSANGAYYKENAETYIAKLQELDKEYTEVITKDCFVLLCDRYPFTYLFQDYGIAHDQAFNGCTTDVDCKFDTIIRLADEIKDRNLKYVFIIEGSKTTLADSVIRASGKSPEILVLNSMQSVSEGDIDGGATYLGIMKDNLEVFRKLCHN